jgi:predicted ATP-grasp superfamily ATP-dependent carboligase
MRNLCRRVKVPYPETCTAEEYQGEFSYPLVVKTRAGFGSYGLSFVASENGLETALARARRYSPEVVIQEYVGGGQLFVSGLFNRGKIRDVACHMGIRGVPRYTNGSTTLRVSLRCPVAEGYFRKVLESLNWHGVAQINFTVGERGVHVLDINPRFWGGIYHTMQSGVDVPYHLFRMIVDGDVPFSEPQLNGVCTRWFWGDLAGLFSDLVGRKKGALRDFLSLRPGERWEDLDLSDPAPFFSAALPYLGSLLKMNPASWEKCYLSGNR